MHCALASSTRMRWIYLGILFTLLCPKLCDGYAVNCTVSKDARGELYRVPEFQAEDCWYSWSDKNHTVLANHLRQIKGLVVTQTNHTLLLKKCQLLIYYQRNCFSEKGPFRGTCQASCPDEDADFDLKVNGQTGWVLITFVISIALGLLVGVVLCLVFRARIFRRSCFYSALKRQNTQHRRESMEDGIPF